MIEINVPSFIFAPLYSTASAERYLEKHPNVLTTGVAFPPYGMQLAGNGLGSDDLHGSVWDIIPVEIVMRVFSVPFAMAAGVCGLFAVLSAQGPIKPNSGIPGMAPPPRSPSPGSGPKNGDLYMQTKIGSFKLIDGTGKVELKFSGTILVSQLKGKATPSAGLRKEYDDKGRQVYHGQGTLTIEGQFRGIQWFGTNMSGHWYGNGVARMIGEFDNNLETGYYWWGNNPKERMPMSSYGMTVVNPPMKMGGTGTPMERPKSGGSGG